MRMIEIYGRANCPWCDKAMELVVEHSFEAVYHDIVEPANYAQFLMRSKGAKTVPQIFAGERHIGGFEDFKRLVDAGEIQQLIGGNS